MQFRRNHNRQHAQSARSFEVIRRVEHADVPDNLPASATLSVPPRVRALAIATFVENGHRFVRGTRLELREIRARMGTTWAVHIRGIHALRGGTVLYYVSDLLALVIDARANLAHDIVDIRTRGTRKTHTRRSLFDFEQVTASRAEAQRHNRL